MDQPHPIDRLVGSRVRARRKLLGVSQEELAQTLGITFQQVQKYERGANRISASRLYQVAQALKTPIARFFDEIAFDDQSRGSDELFESEESAFGFLATDEGRELAQTYPKLSPKQRRAVLALAQACVADE